MNMSVMVKNIMTTQLNKWDKNINFDGLWQNEAEIYQGDVSE